MWCVWGPPDRWWNLQRPLGSNISEEGDLETGGCRRHGRHQIFQGLLPTRCPYYVGNKCFQTCPRCVRDQILSTRRRRIPSKSLFLGWCFKKSDKGIFLTEETSGQGEPRERVSEERGEKSWKENRQIYWKNSLFNPTQAPPHLLPSS
jgi:hypothetical protein